MGKKKKAKWVLWGVLAIVVFVVFYAVFAGRVVTERMSALKWELPSRIFAAPMILYPGAPVLKSDLEQYLNRLGYRKVGGTEPGPGQYRIDGGTYLIGIRSFRDPAEDHKATTLRITLANERVVSLNESPSGAEIFTATLEPERVGEVYSSQRQQRTVVPLARIPRTLKDAILVLEDREFYTHHGISLKGILRAVLHNFRGGHVAEGGSTLTQQLMKNFFLTPERTLSRKVKELVMTIVAELLYSKDEILEAYVNEIYLGQKGSTSIHGFGEAARFYFSKDVDQISIGEQALLAGLISSPGKYSPYTHLNTAYERRGVVLKRLLENGRLTQKEFEHAKAEAIEPRGAASEERFAPFFVDYVKTEISSRFPDVSLEREGYELHTTLDPLLQRLAEAAVAKGLKALGKKGEGAEAALLAVHPRTGAIKAMVGGRDYSSSQFNRVTQAKRSIGSLVKPFVAAAALSPGADGAPPAATVSTILEDRPATFSFEGKDWAPKNYEKKYLGTVPLRKAIESSLNLATINLATRIPLATLTDQLKAVGLDAARALPSVTLGAFGSSLWEMARAYSVFPGGGLLPSLQGVAGVMAPDGRRLELKSMETSKVLEPEVAYLVTSVLTGVVDRGTARSVRGAGIQLPLAGKTGTTDDYRDSWFVGFTPSLVVAVWVGRDDNQPVNLSGASGALPIWIGFMKEAAKRSAEQTFEVPPDVVWFDVDEKAGCRGGSGETLHEPFLKGTEPPKCR